jgi:hypothetical protein
MDGVESPELEGSDLVFGRTAHRSDRPSMVDVWIINPCVWASVIIIDIALAITSVLFPAEVVFNRIEHKHS